MDHKGTKRIETERLILRRFKYEDHVDMFRNWASDAEVTRYMSWLPHQDIEATKKILFSWIESYDKPEFYNWAIELKESREVIGSIGIIDLSNQHDRCEIGYCLGKRFWNRGLMTEALKSIIEFAQNDLRCIRVQAIHHSKNSASGRVMQKAGMEYEGRLRNFHLNNKGYAVDCDMYSSIKSSNKHL